MKPVHNVSENQRWRKPTFGTVKINCDASMDSGSPMTGIAAIARDYNGKIIDGTNAVVRTTSVRVAEALALRLGSVLENRWQWQSIIFESNNKELIYSVKNKVG